MAKKVHFQNIGGAKTGKGNASEQRVTKSIMKGPKGPIPFPEASVKPNEARAIDPNKWHPMKKALKAPLK